MQAARPSSNARSAPDPARELARVRALAARCERCPLYLRGTQTVFGEGDASARVMFVGEQPGDREDLVGRPFVGPAGKLLSRALERAGIERGDVYVTNAVKHFKWIPRGKRRMHQKPAAREIDACAGWLEAELRIVRPDVLVCLGATAAMALLGKQFRITKDRGRFVPSELAPRVLATAHPSSVLRAPSSADREAAFDALVADLRVAARALEAIPARRSHTRRAEELTMARARKSANASTAKRSTGAIEAMSEGGSESSEDMPRGTPRRGGARSAARRKTSTRAAGPARKRSSAKKRSSTTTRKRAAAPAGRTAKKRANAKRSAASASTAKKGTAKRRAGAAKRRAARA